MTASNSKDWKGGRFVLISLFLAFVVIFFFFAGRHIFHTMNQIVASWDSKGWTITQTELEILNKDEVCCQDAFVSRAKKEVRSYEGRWFFQAQPSQMIQKFSQEPFVAYVSARRSYQGRLSVQLSLFKPAMLVRGEEAWLLVNKEGRFLSVVQVLKEEHWTLPMIFGLENRLSGDTQQLNHYLVREARWLSQLSRLREELSTRLQIHPQEWTVHENSWSGEAFVEARWQDLTIELPLQLDEEAWRALQFILSDLRLHENLAGRLKGRFGKKWFFTQNVKET